MHHISNNWLRHIFFFSEDSHTKWLFALLHQGLEGFTQVGTDPKRKFVSFNVTPSKDRVLCVYVLSGHNTWEELDREDFFEGLESYMKKKSE